jgi:hypothetical protein
MLQPSKVVFIRRLLAGRQSALGLDIAGAPIAKWQKPDQLLIQAIRPIPRAERTSAELARGLR